MIKFEDLVIFENDDYLAINKPPGIASLHERIGEGYSIIELAQNSNPNLQLCHRIDKETSGVLLLAKHPKAYQQASIQFEKRKISKVYHAVVDGVHSFKDLEVNLPLTITRSGRSKVSYEKGKESKTIFSTLKVFGHYTLIAAKPVSGRLHQIRAHLQSQNASISGDTTYSGKWPYLSKIKKKYSSGKYEEEQPMIKRFALHAHSISFSGLDGTLIHIEADYPKDFAVFIKLLEKYDASKF